MTTVRDITGWIHPQLHVL